METNPPKHNMPKQAKEPFELLAVQMKGIKHLKKFPLLRICTWTSETNRELFSVVQSKIRISGLGELFSVVQSN